MNEPSRTSEITDALVLEGIPAAPGIVVGKALVYVPEEWTVPELYVEESRTGTEYRRFQDAIEHTRRTLRELRDKLDASTDSDRLPSDAETPSAFIFQSHLFLLDDPMFQERVQTEILDNRRTAESAVALFAEQMVKAFRELEDRFFQEKAADIHDVMRHVFYNLGREHQYPTLAERLEAAGPSIVVARELVPSDTLLIPPNHLLGLATEGGSPISHVAILANALQIPAVVGLGMVLPRTLSGETVILDGGRGTLTVRPTEAQLRASRKQLKQREAFEQQVIAAAHEPAVTTDGTPVRLTVNIEFPLELDACRQYGADGVGLYRTEYGFISRDSLPTEEELYADYVAVVKRLAPMEVTFRTVDLGGDKLAPFLKSESDHPERRRGLRLCLRHPEIWMPQLRAIWRAAAHGRARLMFPLVPGLYEFRAAKALVLRVRDNLQKEGIPCADSLPIGVMIELPSAVMVADLLAEEADFFSIGTNDLIPYSLGLERTNMDLTMISEPFHPAILRAIRRVVSEGQRSGKPVSVCGETAGDPFSVLLLLGMGIRELSMNPSAIPEIKGIIRKATVAEAETLTKTLLNLKTAGEVDAKVHGYMTEHYADILPLNRVS